jgi:hypothetical protein
MPNTIFKIFIGVLVSILCFSASCPAEVFDSKKSEMKKAKSWTLSEWLAQKERNKMMDLWLMMHTPSPLEFALSYWHKSVTESTAASPDENVYAATRAAFMAYATLVGLEFQYEESPEKKWREQTGIFHFRIFGVADQATHLTLNFGQKTRKYLQLSGDSLRSQNFGEVDLTLYFNDHFGMQSTYRKYLPIEDDATWGTLNALQYEAGAFIDFNFFRVELLLVHEEESKLVGSAQTDWTSEGYKSGIKIFF